MEGTGINRKLNKTLSQHSFITIYKSFVRPNLDYSNIIYDQPNNVSLNQKEFSKTYTERIQYNAPLAITGIIKITSHCSFYNALNLLNLGVGLGISVPFKKSKQLVYCNTCLILFHKPIIYIILVQQRMLQHFKVELMQVFFLSTCSIRIRMNKRGWNIQPSKTMLPFRNLLLKTGQPIPKPIYNIYNPTDLILLTI